MRSNQQYENSSILLTAQDKDFLSSVPIICPGYFTKTNTGSPYADDTLANKINITLAGYSSVDFEEAGTR